MTYNIRFGNSFSKWTSDYPCAYSCDQNDYPILKECLLRAVGEDRAFETEDGLTIKDGYSDLGVENIFKFQDDCRMVLTCAEVYGAQSEELFAVSDYLFSSGQYKDVDGCGVPVPTDNASTMVARDVHGCFLGTYTLDAIRKKWHKSRHIDNVISVELTVSFDEAVSLVEGMKRLPYYSERRVRESIIGAYRSHCCKGDVDATEKYWQSQLDVSWDVLYRDDKPICTVPYSIICCTFGRAWFCSAPHTAQVVPVVDIQQAVGRALRLAEQEYKTIAPAGKVCTRRVDMTRGESPVCVQSEIIADADGLVSVVDADDRLLGIWRPQAVINKYKVVVPVDGGYRTFDSGKQHLAIDRQRILKILNKRSTSSSHRAILIESLKEKDEIVRVLSKERRFIGYFRESYIRATWQVIRCGEKYVINATMTDAERLKSLSQSLMSVKGLSQSMRMSIRDEQRAISEREVRKERVKPLKKNLIATIVQVANNHLSNRFEITTNNKVIKMLKFRLEGNQTNVIVARVARGFDAMGETHATLDGEELTPKELVARAWEGDEGAVCLVAKAMARDIEAGRTSQHAPKPAPAGDIPDWAKPQRAYVIEWADRTLAGEGQLKNQPAVLYVASAIKSGKADVLVFDSPLYDEVASAELEGRAEYDAASWPYPVSVVRLVGFPGVHGVAVCKASDVNAYAKRQGLPQLSEAGSLHTFFIGDGLGAVDASLKARREADRLITYLDCDNANINIIYIDGGARTDRRNEPAGKPQNNVEYRAGADYVTGTRVVVERDQQRDAPRQTRRAHFRRGFHKRFRIGPREDWHYEIRWVKPTFVHGSSQAVTQHKVTRIVLG